MYKVTYSDKIDCLYGPVVSQGEKVEPCLMFALDLHRASNVSHVVRVIRDYDDDSAETIVVTLKAEDNGK